MGLSKIDLSKVDPSTINMKSVYRRLSPEERAKHKRLAELAALKRERQRQGLSIKGVMA